MNKEVEKIYKEIELIKIDYKKMYQDMQTLKAEQAYNFAYKRYYILTKENQYFINEKIIEFYRDAKNNINLIIDGIKFDNGSNIYIRIDEDYMNVALDIPNSNHDGKVPTIFRKDIGEGFAIRLDYKTDTLSITEIL